MNQFVTTPHPLASNAELPITTNHVCICVFKLNMKKKNLLRFNLFKEENLQQNQAQNRWPSASTGLVKV